MDELTPAQVQHLQRRVKDRMAVEDRGYKTPCWISNRASHAFGYTKIGYLGKTLLVHRVSYRVFVGPIPDGLVIDHLCRVPACCNPDHLEPVTNQINLLRGEGFVGQQARRTHCPRNHALAGDNIYRRPDGSNRRECRTCRNTYRHRHPVAS